MKAVSLLLLIFATVLTTACATTSHRLHPSLNQELELIDTIVIAPPRVEIELLTLTGENERLTALERAISRQLITIAERKAAERGYEVIDFDFDRAIKEDAEFAYTVTEIRDGFERAKADLKLGQKMSKEDAGKIRTSVGEAVNVIADRSGADAILLIRYFGYDKSTGYLAKEIGTSLLVSILTGGEYYTTSEGPSAAMTEAALIDGTTGEVLWADIMRGALGADIGEISMRSMPEDVDPLMTAPANSDPAITEVPGINASENQAIAGSP